MLSFQPCKKNFQDSKTHDDIYIYIYIDYEKNEGIIFCNHDEHADIDMQ